MTSVPSERHPLAPFLPEGASILMLGSFPPKREKWSMEFFYPNWINDMWRIMGHIFMSDKDAFVCRDSEGNMLKRFDRERIEKFCREQGIALFDAATEVRRMKDNASDKFLEIVEPTDLGELLERIPDCRIIVTTGQKATEVVAETFGCSIPAVGDKVEIQTGECRKLDFWRMPSSSRAYPMALEKKAEFYRRMFAEISDNNG